MLEHLSLENALLAARGLQVQLEMRGRRLAPDLAGDGRQPVLVNRADHRTDVGQFEGALNGLHHRQNLRGSHGHLDRPVLEERMPERQNAVSVPPRDRPSAGKGEIAAHQHAGHGRARLKVVIEGV